MITEFLVFMLVLHLHDKFKAKRLYKHLSERQLKTLLKLYHASKDYHSDYLSHNVIQFLMTDDDFMNLKGLKLVRVQPKSKDIYNGLMPGSKSQVSGLGRNVLKIAHRRAVKKKRYDEKHELKESHVKTGQNRQAAQ